MKATTRLAIWLGSKKKTYHEGFEILRILAVNPKRNRFYDTPIPSAMQKNMLLNDLVRYARINRIKPKTVRQIKVELAKADVAFKKIITPAVETGGEIKTGGRVQIFKNPKVNYDELPPELQELYDKFADWYADYDLKRAKLHKIPADPKNNAARKKIANEVITLKETIRKAWDKIDKWWSSRDDGPKEITKPSGKLTKTEIENIKDPEVKALSKRLRIEANFRFISRNKQSTSAKVIEKLELRKKELTEWDIDHAKKLTEN